MMSDWPEADRRTPPEDRRAHVTPQQLYDALSALMQHLEEEDSVRRSVDELRGVVGSISGELGQMKEASQAVCGDIALLRKAVSDLQTTTNVLGHQIGIHIEQAQPVMEASEAFLVLARAGSLVWRLKWWGVSVALAILFLARGDTDAVLRAVQLISGIHMSHKPE